MNRLQKILTLVLTIVLLSGLAITHESHIVNALPSAEGEPENYVFLDVTYDPETKNYSLSGFSKDQLQQMGIPELQDVIWVILERFESLRLELGNAAVNLKADDKDLATINWDAESRDLIYGLLDSYGVKISDLSKERLETWLSKADIVLNVRNSPEISKPIVLDLSTLLMVDVNKEGKLSVEGFDTGVYLQPQVADIASSGGVTSATLCWSKGILNSMVNGNTLPQVTLYQDGLQVVENALGLGLGDIGLFFKSQVGASVAFDGGTHETMECGQP